MAQIKTFEDLAVWQKAHTLLLFIYEITATFPGEEKFNLVSQMRRAALSIASNIVEGFRRSSIKDSVHFYNIADSSLEELKYQLLVSRDLGYIDDDTYQKGKEKSQEVGKMLNSWKSSQLHNSK